MKKIQLLLIFILFHLNNYSQYYGSEQFFVDHIKLAYDSANYVFEGKVIDKQSYWNAKHNFIYTSHTVKIEKVLRGTINSSEVLMITEGGTVGTTSLDITHNLGFGVGEIGMFFAKIAERPMDPSTQPVVPVLQDYDGVFVKYYTNGADTSATYYISKFTCLEQLRTLLEKKKLINCTQKQKKKSISEYVKTSKLLTINGTPQQDVEVIGGVGDQIEITGTNLGTTGFIRLRNADDGGQTWLTLDPYDIVMWGETSIIFTVPSLIPIADPTIAKTPGSGKVRVIFPLTSDSAETSNNLIILWSWKNYAIPSVPIKKYLVLSGDSPDQGFDFTLNADITADLLTKSNVQLAIDEWICTTEVRWKISPLSTFVNSKIQDGINVITFGTTTQSWITAQTFVFSDRCEGPLGTPDEIGYVYEIDIIINDTKTWFIQDSITQVLPANEYDFYATILHELGHAVLLQHVNDPSDIMFWTLPTGTPPDGTPYLSRKTGFSIDNIDGGSLIVNVSANTNYINCTQSLPMIPLSVGNCTFNPSGINEREKPEDILLTTYPNPFSNYTTISYKLDNTADVQLSVFDYTGVEHVKIFQKNQQVGKYKIKLDGNSLSQGFYFIRLLVNDKSYTAKLIHFN